jgi:hypothetical protein
MHNIPEQQIPLKHNFLKISDNERNYRKIYKLMEKQNESRLWARVKQS